jgi:hypothetical protein
MPRSDKAPYPSPAQRTKVAERRRKAVDMRIAGKPWQEIADALGYDSRSSASKDVQRAMQQAIVELQPPLEELRQLELERLDAELDRLNDLYAQVEAILRREHVTIQHGHVVLLNEQPILDFAPVLAAADRLLRIEDARRKNGERRAKLLGLDQAQRVEVLTIDAIDQQLRQLNAELAALDSEDRAAAGAEATSD